MMRELTELWGEKGLLTWNYFRNEHPWELMKRRLKYIVKLVKLLI